MADTRQLAQVPAENGNTFAGQCELAKLRRERDAAVAQEHDQLRRARDAAVADSQQVRAQLECLQQEHAALREAHAVCKVKAEQQTERSAQELATAARKVECLHAAQVSLAAAEARHMLRIDALETQQAVLIDCYQALETERQQACRHGPASPFIDHTERLEAVSASIKYSTRAHGGAGAGWGNDYGNDELALTTANSTTCNESTTQRLARSSSHLALALRCAALQHRLEQQQRETASCSQAAAAAQEQAAGLRLLVARQQAAGGCTAQLQERLSAVCRQLEEARLLGGELQQQLAQKDDALQIALQEKAALQQDLGCMLAAREPLAALRTSLQRAAGSAPLLYA